MIRALFWAVSMIAAVVVLPLVSSCTQSGESYRGTRVLMGTFVDVSIKGNDAKGLSELVFSELKRVEDLTSFHKDSELAEINRSAGSGPVSANKELLGIIAQALDAAKQTNGAFDPTIGAVTRLWGFSGAEGPRLPAAEEITEVIKKVDYSKVVIDENAGTINLPEKGMALDLGGIGKGYALNRAYKILVDKDVKSALINMGGDILAIGEKDPDRPWTIGVEDPRDRRNLVAKIKAKDRMIFTSGDYERSFEEYGKRYHHILDPKTGYPAEGVQSVTLVGPINALIQPFGSAIFVMGVKNGLRFVETVGEISAYVIDDHGKPHVSAGAEGVFQE
jgi:FAD:protein FMN transferase